MHRFVVVGDDDFDSATAQMRSRVGPGCGHRFRGTRRPSGQRVADYGKLRVKGTLVGGQVHVETAFPTDAALAKEVIEQHLAKQPLSRQAFMASIPNPVRPD